MNLLKIQAVLARIYTDAAFRGRFFSDPLAAGQEMGLLPEDALRIAQLHSGEVHYFAGSLVRKRLNEVRKLLPLTHEALGPEFGRQFHRFVAQQDLKSKKQHRQDAIAFAAFLERASLGEPSSRALELARCEAASLQASEPGVGPWLRYFCYPIPQLVRRTVLQQAVAELRPEPTLAIWFRFTSQGQLRHFVLSLSRLVPGSAQTTVLRWLRPLRDRVPAHIDLDTKGGTPGER